MHSLDGAMLLTEHRTESGGNRTVTWGKR